MKNVRYSTLFFRALIVSMIFLVLCMLWTKRQSAVSIQAGNSLQTNGSKVVRQVTYWHAGNFRYLPETSDSFLDVVSNLNHPTSGYKQLSSTRKAHFNAFIDEMFTAIDDSLADGDTGNWCEVKAKATAAGYAIRRFYDTYSGRYFIYGYDTQSTGQARFFINPYAKRNIIVEVPHEPFDTGTKMEGARIFRAVAARALIINGAHRCASVTTSSCDGRTSTCTSDENVPYTISDVAHSTLNTFHLLHRKFSDIDSNTKFIQLHGMKDRENDKAEVSDTTTNDYDLNSVSVTFTENLKKYALTPAYVYSCQGFEGNPPRALCAGPNVQGRYTNRNDPMVNECTNGTSRSSGRFIHVEQSPTLTDNDSSDGWYWELTKKALLDTWPSCNMNNGKTDCTLGPRQTQYSNLTCQ